MKRSEIYRKAARRIERLLDDACCIAIANIVGGLSRHRPYYDYSETSVFAEIWGMDCEELGQQIGYDEGSNDHRVVLLCLGAAIAEDEEGTDG